MVVLKQYDDGVVVRTAQAQDKQAVCEIEGFGDVDYIQAKYDHYMENTVYQAYLAELNGKAVAFTFTYLVDDGKAIIWGGKRVHQDFQGQGLLSKLISAVEEYTRSQYPDVTTWRYSASWNEFNEKKYVPKLREQGALIQLAIRNILFYDTSLGDLHFLLLDTHYKKLCADYDVASVVTVTDNVIPPALLDPAVQKDIFPDNYVIVAWHPYRPLKSNFQYIMRTSQCNITYSGDDKIVAATFLSSFPCPQNTLRIDIELYVSEALGEEGQWFYLKQHLLKALTYKWLNLEDSTKCILMIFYPRKFDVPETRSWLKEYFPQFTQSQRKHHVCSFQYMACDYDRTKLE